MWYCSHVAHYHCSGMWYCGHVAHGQCFAGACHVGFCHERLEATVFSETLVRCHQITLCNIPEVSSLMILHSTSLIIFEASKHHHCRYRHVVFVLIMNHEIRHPLCSYRTMRCCIVENYSICIFR